MTDMELQKDDDGNYVMKRADFRLHVGTGEEAEQQWPSVQVDEEVMPLLNMPEAWQMIIDEKQLPVKKKLQGEFLQVNAKIMVNEISYHLLASTAVPQKKEHDKPQHENGSTRVKETEEAKPEQTGKDHDGDEKSGSDDGETTQKGAALNPEDIKGKSVYGSSLVLKLQWEEKSPQKAVPHRTCEELGKFIHELTRDLLHAMEKNEDAGKAVLDTLAFELTLLLLARYMEGIETGTAMLEHSAYELLTLCAEHANPKEMCMALRILARKIDIVYVEATSYLIVEPLLRLWTRLVLRIPRKRHYFLNDLIKTWERLFNHAEAYELSFVQEDTEGVAKPGRISQVSDILLDFFEDLTTIQLNQRDVSDAIRLKVDELGRQRLEARVIEAVEAPGNDEDTTQNGEADGKGEDSSAVDTGKEKAAPEATEDQSSGDGEKAVGKTSSQAVTIDDETRDWVSERATTLARVLIIQGMIWNELQPPEGEERESPHRKSKRANKHAREMALIAKKNEYALLRCHRLFKNLGWSNPVLVCQMVGGDLHLDPCSYAEELFREHIKHDVRSKKERKGTLHSINSVGLYLCGVLRPRTRRLLEGKSCDGVDDYLIDLTGTGFDLLDPLYALHLALPYLMAIIADSTRARPLGATLVVRAFLARIPDGGYDTFEDVIQLRCSVNAMGREVNIVGLSQHLVKAVAGCDDPKHRRVSYETFQLVLQKVRHPHARYTIVECVFHECKRVAVAAQLVTEMKDAVRYSDILAEKGDPNWSDADASSLKTRFVEVILPMYFTPKKEMLMSVNAIVVVAGVVIWLGGSDKRLLKRLAKGDKLRESVEKRMRFVKERYKVGRECIRALAAVAEHDRKNMPTSQLARTNTSEAQALFAASGRTLNNCMTALSLLSAAEPFFESTPTGS